MVKVLIVRAFEWIRTMIYYVEARKSSGDDWTKHAIILSVVAVFTLAPGLVFQTKNLEKVYNKTAK